MLYTRVLPAEPVPGAERFGLPALCDRASKKCIGQGAWDRSRGRGRSGQRAMCTSGGEEGNVLNIM